MIEQIMIFGIGFLVAILLALLVIPLVHNRAVRLTKKRLEAAAPLSMAELQADKDQLRAEFAVQARRLELLIEHLKSENAGQFAELGKRTDAINVFKLELTEKDSQINALQLRQSELEEQLQASRDEVAAKIMMLGEFEKALGQKQAEIASVMTNLTERELAGDSQRVEIIALNAQIDALNGQINDLRVQMDAAHLVETDLRSRLSNAQLDTDAAWSKEHAENEQLRDRINSLAAEFARLTMTLEGPRSPIEKLLNLAEETQGASGTNGGNGISGTTNTSSATPRTTAPNLGDRIRALQSRAVRPPPNG